MRYYVTVNGQTIEVDLSGDEPMVDGRPMPADMAVVPGTPTRHLLVDGRSHVLVAARESKDSWQIHLDGERLELEVIDERTRAIRAMTGQGAVAAGPKPVKAPMPGLVVRINVKEGDAVERGTSVVIIEAMKMENDLKAESAGVVTRIHVEEGQPVEKGTVLVELAAEEDAPGA